MGCCYAAENTESNNHKTSRLLSGLVITPGDFVKLNSSPIRHFYTFQDVIGSGGYAEVHRALHIQTNSIRAIKSIGLQAQDSLVIEKLMKEVTILKQLDHPNIIRVFEVFKNRSKLYIITEFCSGGELFDRIKAFKKFSENQAAKYFLEIVTAVMHCHQQGIVHRDLKPENLLFENSSDNAKLKLIDFGTSQFFDNTKRMKKLMGTYYYMAPEVIQGDYDEKCDIWSLGIILYILLSGVPPFSGRTDEEIISKIQNSPLSFSHSNWQSVSDEAKMLISKMLKKSPLARASIQDIFKDPWLQSRGNYRIPDINLQANTLISLSNFKIESKLQKAIYSYIVSQMLDSQYFVRLREVFTDIDKNGDGRLSVDELNQALDKFNLDLDIEEMITQCDSDRNGFINYTEFLTATVNKNQAYSKERLKNVFKIFDKNKDGKLSLHELKSALGEDNKSENVIKQMIQEADIDGDGEIDLEEFIMHMTKFNQ